MFMTEMVMEAQQEVTGSKELMQIIKGKRTKRQRPSSPLSLAISTTKSSSSGEEHERIFAVDNNTSSPSSSVNEFAESTRGEEEDMANCLILLAQGHHARKLSHSHHQLASTTTTTTTSKPHQGLFAYECKTCNRCFPSFQALGGHRASHKKPKAIIEEKKRCAVTAEEEEDQRHIMSTALSLQIADRSLGTSNVGKSNKLHECSICGAEFSSGQALGGHMRRHRAFATNSTATRSMSLVASSSDESPLSKKPRNSLQLDLNLPAPEDHDPRDQPKFHFTSKGKVLIFSASAVVDCHY
ncbi:hypothetical protein K2173_019360 [Erythroxylum novogranatense]|uniref:C2H2-type domain-containing protein n=1 Tax=Erythroxylum novogranatense TaxID=1862640 RepID=A0AAV8UF09_9ROSI|nr:hypothetical protein K2173_019360 [Erythroxylum novogranatense]